MSRGILTTPYDKIQLARFSKPEVVVVESAFRFVWKKMIECTGFQPANIATADENAFSVSLQEIFNCLRNAPELKSLAKHFDPVPDIDSKRRSVNYKGDHPNKQPDFAFRRKVSPPGESRLDGCFFVEAKLIEPNKTMSWYCGGGLIKFVNGDYAWAASQAMMLGYKRKSKYSLPTPLKNYLSGRDREYENRCGPIPFSMPCFKSSMYLTKHDRNWTSTKLSEPPGMIEVYHLWLDVRIR